MVLFSYIDNELELHRQLDERLKTLNHIRGLFAVFVLLSAGVFFGAFALFETNPSTDSEIMMLFFLLFCGCCVVLVILPYRHIVFSKKRRLLFFACNFLLAILPVVIQINGTILLRHFFIGDSVLRQSLPYYFLLVCSPSYLFLWYYFLSKRIERKRS